MFDPTLRKELLRALIAQYKLLRAEIRMFDGQFVISALLQMVAIISFYEFPEHSAFIFVPGIFGIVLFLRALFSSWNERMPAVKGALDLFNQISELPDKTESIPMRAIFPFDYGRMNSNSRKLFDGLFFGGAHFYGLGCMFYQLIIR